MLFIPFYSAAATTVNGTSLTSCHRPSQSTGSINNTVTGSPGHRTSFNLAPAGPTGVGNQPSFGSTVRWLALVWSSSPGRHRHPPGVAQTTTTRNNKSWIIGIWVQARHPLWLPGQAALQHQLTSPLFRRQQLNPSIRYQPYQQLLLTLQQDIAGNC